MALPSSQRAVVTLRDVEGCTAPEVCSLGTVRPEALAAEERHRLLQLFRSWNH